jgi:hypothetical protein
MASDLERTGGLLRIGLYTRKGDVSDMRTLLAALVENSGSPGILPGLSVNPEVIRALRAEYDTLQAVYPGPAHPLPVGEPGQPQIHLKAQFFASAEALGVLSRPEWGPILSRYLAIRRRQTAAPDRDFEGITPALLFQAGAGDSTARNVCAVHCDSLGTLDPGSPDRVFYFATVGSHNQDRRSMMLDGEVLVGISGPAALTVALDFAGLAATTTWIEDHDQLSSHFPVSTSFMKKFRRWIRNLI